MMISIVTPDHMAAGHFSCDSIQISNMTAVDAVFAGFWAPDSDPLSDRQSQKRQKALTRFFYSYVVQSWRLSHVQGFPKVFLLR